MRKALLWVHLVAGLVSALFLIALGLSGALLAFEPEIDHKLNARLAYVRPLAWHTLPLDDLTARVERAHPRHKVSALSLPASNDLAVKLTLRALDGGKPLNVAVDPYTGEELGSLDTANTWMRTVQRFHVHLLVGETGKLITTWSSILLAVLAVSGLILWWPRKLLRFRRTGSGRQTNHELHHVLGFYASVFMLLFAATGVVIHWEEPTRDLVNRLAGVEGKLVAPKVAPATSGAVPLGAGTVHAIALQSMPGARVTYMQGIGVLGKPIGIWMKFPEDHTPSGRSSLLLDPVTGEVLSARSSRTAPIGFRVAKLWNRQIHTGDILGFPGRILACLASLALPILTLTGVLIWWGRIRRKRRAAVAG